MASKESRWHVLREAGPLERFHIDRAEVGFDTCVVVSAKYAANDRMLDERVLYPALARVIAQLPPLAVQVSVPDKPRDKPVFVSLSTISLDEVVSFVDDDVDDDSTYEDVLRPITEAQLSESLKLGTSAPLWRLVVVGGHTVVFAYYHGIGDGQSGMAFHRALLIALNAPPDTTTPLVEDGKVEVPEYTFLAFSPAVEKLTNVSPPFSVFCKTLFETFAPAPLKKSWSAWTGNPVVQTPSVDTSVRLWEVSVADSDHLLKLCRKHKTTFTAFFHTLLVGVISQHVTNLKGKKKFKRLSTITPLSLRRYTKTPSSSICLQVSVYHFYPRITPFLPSKTSYSDFPWDTATKITQKFRARADITRRTAGMAKFVYVLGINQAYFTDNIGKKREGTLGLSNLGRFPALNEEEKGTQDWSIGSMFFTQCDSVTGAALKMNIVGSPSGSVNIGFSWGPGSIDQSLADAIIEDSKIAFASILATAPSDP